MNTNTFISSIIFIIMIQNMYNTTQEIEESQNTQISPFMQKFQNGYYLFFYTIFWGFIIDYSIYQIMYNKQSFDNVSQHTKINFIIVFGQMINNCCFFQSYRLWFNFWFITIEFAIAVLELLQVLLGNRIQMLKLQKQYTSNIQFNKKIHKYLGCIIYILHKFNLSFYTFMYFIPKSTLTAIFSTIQVLLLPFLSFSWLYFMSNLGRNKIEVQQEECLINYQEKKKEQYQHIVQTIENNKIEDNSNNKISLTSNIDQVQIKQNRENTIKWVMIEDNIFDLTGYMHPLGRYILKKMQKQDITREYYGLKSCLFYNKKTKAKKSFKHIHCSKTHNFIENRCISKINIESFIKIKNIQERNSSTTVPFEINKIQDIEDQSVQQKYNWKIDLYYPEQENQKTKIFQLKDISEELVIDLKSFWPNFFGKYFLITTQQQEIDWIYFSFSLSPAFIKHKIEWVSQIKQNISDDIYQHLSQDVHKLNLFYELDKNQQLLSNCRHLCLIGSIQNFEQLNNKKLQLSKPLGGLGIESFSCQNYLFIVKDKAIYPLIDLIEFLTCKTLMEMSDMKIQHFIFDKDYFSYFFNQPKIYIYLEISKEYEQEAQFLIMNNLQLINKQYQCDSDKKINQILRKIVICMNDVESNSILINKTRKKAKNFKSILNSLKISKSKKPDMVLLGGDDEFQERVIKEYNLKQSKLRFL